MSREKAIRYAANQLMDAHKKTKPFSLDDTSQGLGFRAAKSGSQYTPSREAEEAVWRATRRIVQFIDFFPLDLCYDHLMSLVIEALDQGSKLQEAHTAFHERITEFINRFTAQGQWEVVFAVSGIAVDWSGEFTIGTCSFYLMDENRFREWGQRWSTGEYTPPTNSPIDPTWRIQAAMENQTVVATRVTAVDEKHAWSKGKHRIEEAIALLRYGMLCLEDFDGRLPAIGLSYLKMPNNQSFVVRLDGAGFAGNRTVGSSGCDYEICKGVVPSWDKLEKIVKSELADRSELELRVMTALTWISHAAAAPANTMRLVSLVTALESLLILESESLGKRSKLANRIDLLTRNSVESQESVFCLADKMYQLRSECVHAGLLEVEDDALKTFVRLVSQTIAAIVGKCPFSSMNDLSEIIAHIEGNAEPAVDIKWKWIEENAYYRWLDERAWVADGCPPTRQDQHWSDAEREFYQKRRQ